MSTSKLRELSKANFGEHFELGPAAPSSDGKLLSHYVHPGSRLRAEFLVVGRVAKVTAGEHVEVVEFGRSQDPADLYLPDFDGARSALLAAEAAGEEHDRSKKSVFDYGINLAPEQVEFASPEAAVLEVGGIVFILVTLYRVDVPVLIPGSVDPSHARLLNTLPHDPSQICVYRIQFIFPFDISLSYKEKGIVAIERLQWRSILVPFHAEILPLQCHLPHAAAVYAAVSGSRFAAPVELRLNAGAGLQNRLNTLLSIKVVLLIVESSSSSFFSIVQRQLRGSQRQSAATKQRLHLHKKCRRYALANTLAKADFGKRECNGNQKKRPEDGDFEVVRGTSAETPMDMMKGTQQDDDSTDKDMSPRWQ
ncbi:hypothetical protein C8R43DRAFT_965723 [Mycena crocata]|nr:hypothetical protein C8R43DRAFT_965723 [Mycena crocata]